jgi:hypothetical protein
MAVGTYTAGAASSFSEAWNGTSWTLEPPNPAAPSSELNGVSCTAANACTAVGDADGGILAERWNGTDWTVQPIVAGGVSVPGTLNGVSCASAKACTAVGESDQSASTGDLGCSLPTPRCLPIPDDTLAQPLMLAAGWNGSTWTVQQTATGGELGSLLGVSGPSSTTCTAVGYLWPGEGPETAVADRLGGGSWSIQTTPSPKGTSTIAFGGVACPAAAYCEAVGGYTLTQSPGVPRTLAERYNGNNWMIQSTP